MASTVNAAFDEFMRTQVRLDPDRNDIAKRSKANLVNEIQKFPNDGKFLLLHPDLPNIDYGSFSRKTKTRPLDDIDLMIVLHARGNWRNQNLTGGYTIHVPQDADKQRALCNDGTDTLNSIKVINKFKEYLSKVPSYKNAEIKRNQEAVTLELGYEWVYDIVPCFITSPENGNDFFLIPDGNGKWKPTDPRIDKERTTRINGKQDISVLDVVRIMKYWTKRRTAHTMGSYFLECLILHYYDTYGITSSKYIDLELPKIFAHVYHQIDNPLNDPKGFQGNLNTLSWDERKSIKDRAELDFNRATEARQLETDGKQKESIAKWREIFGSDFPYYSI
ncbi:hypothetical protein [Pedobacter frigidisoli]|uniref:hypothetical protein n=1 Tax=Pedobacter frigidisoli TaxID=2530455 RepID=UPI00292F96D7|nr:hypothetical protein [Pedobacter frigidisoli]